MEALTSVKVLRLLSVVMAGLSLVLSKEYRFCSRDNSVLYSFTSEACPGGIFLKEPIIMNSKCYCHDTDVQLLSYCNTEVEPDPRLLIPHSPAKCQKSLLPSKDRPPGYNKIRVILLSDEASSPLEPEECVLPCLGNFTKEMIANSVIGSNGVRLEEQIQLQKAAFEKIMGKDALGPDEDPLKNEMVVEALLKRAEQLRLQYQKNGKIDPTMLESFGKEFDGSFKRGVRSDTAAGGSTEPNYMDVDDTAGESSGSRLNYEKGPIQGPGSNPPFVSDLSMNPIGKPGLSDDLSTSPEDDKPDISNPVDPMTELQTNLETNSVSAPDTASIISPVSSSATCDASQLCDQFPPYPDTGLTEAQKEEILKNNVLSPLNMASSKSSKIMPVSSTFEAIHRAVEIYKRLLPPEIAGDDLIEEILSRFHSTFEAIDAAPATDTWKEPKKIFEGIQDCEKRTLELKFTYDDGCPPQVDKFVWKGKEVPVVAPTKGWEDRKFKDLNQEDLVVGIIFKVLDTVAAHCEELHKNGLKSKFMGNMISMFKNNKEIFQKWFTAPVTNYKGSLRHDDMKILAENIDKVDIAVHMAGRTRDSKEFYKKPIPDGGTLPASGSSSSGWSSGQSQPSSSNIHSPSNSFGVVDWEKIENNVPVSVSEEASGPEVEDADDEETPEDDDGRRRRRRKRSPLFNQNQVYVQTLVTEPTPVTTTTTAPTTSTTEDGSSQSEENPSTEVDVTSNTTQKYDSQAGHTIPVSTTVRLDLENGLRSTTSRPEDIMRNMRDNFKIPETAYDAYLIWGGTAYCLQKKDPSLPVTVENVYPEIPSLCTAHGHKCQAPVSDKPSLQTSILEGCVRVGWESIFLKLASPVDPTVLEVCCYDGKLCDIGLGAQHCEDKCRSYCISIGADPKGKLFYEEGRCVCSSSQVVRRTYLSILAAGK